MDVWDMKGPQSKPVSPTVPALLQNLGCLDLRKKLRAAGVRQAVKRVSFGAMPGPEADRGIPSCLWKNDFKVSGNTCCLSSGSRLGLEAGLVESLGSSEPL